eukprot:4083316-Prymnesium_polylepis.1
MTFVCGAGCRARPRPSRGPHSPPPRPPHCTLARAALHCTTLHGPRTARQVGPHAPDAGALSAEEQREVVVTEGASQLPDALTPKMMATVDAPTAGNPPCAAPLPPLL